MIKMNEDIINEEIIVQKCIQIWKRTVVKHMYECTTFAFILFNEDIIVDFNYGVMDLLLKARAFIFLPKGH